MPPTRSRVLGCRAVGAIGDAMGAPIEFDSIAEIRTRFGPEGVTGFAPASGRLGAITDITQMTLFTAEGLIRAHARYRDRGICNVPWIVWRAYCRWLVTQGGPDIYDADLGSAVSGWLITNEVLQNRRGPDVTCLTALESGRWGTPERPINDSRGCGGVMRVAPVGVLARKRSFDLGAQIAAITHGDPTGYLAAGALAVIINHLLSGRMIDDAVRGAAAELRDRPHHEATLAALNAAVALSARGRPTPEDLEGLGRGWFADEALAIGVCCALAADGVCDGLLLAVNHSGNSASTGAIAGNILGAHYGFEALPGDLLDELEGREVIVQIGHDLTDALVDGRALPSDRYPTY
jgi:ADP-ribosylglycohydrolase